MLDDLEEQEEEVVLSHAEGSDKEFLFTYEAKETGVEDLFLRYTIALVDVLPPAKGGASA